MSCLCFFLLFLRTNPVIKFRYQKTFYLLLCQLRLDVTNAGDSGIAVAIVLLWYPQMNDSLSFWSIQWPKKFHTTVQKLSGMLHTGDNFRTIEKKIVDGPGLIDDPSPIVQAQHLPIAEGKGRVVSSFFRDWERCRRRSLLFPNSGATAASPPPVGMTYVDLPLSVFPFPSTIPLVVALALGVNVDPRSTASSSSLAKAAKHTTRFREQA